MPKRNGKRINPRRIPLAKSEIDIEELITEANRDMLYYAWLIVFPCILEQEKMTYDEALTAWEAVKLNNADLKRLNELDVACAERLTGIAIPHKKIFIGNVQSPADLEKIRQKLRKSAMGIALGTIALGLYYEAHFSKDLIKRIFFNANLTLAEIEHGSTSYEQLYEKLLRYGIELERFETDRSVLTVKSAVHNT